MRLSIRNTKHAYVKRLCLRCNQKINVVLNSICVNSAERVMMNRISFITNPIEQHTEWATEQYNNNIHTSAISYMRIRVWAILQHYCACIEMDVILFNTYLIYLLLLCSIDLYYHTIIIIIVLKFKFDQNTYYIETIFYSDLCSRLTVNVCQKIYRLSILQLIATMLLYLQYTFQQLPVTIARTTMTVRQKCEAAQIDNAYRSQNYYQLKIDYIILFSTDIIQTRIRSSDLDIYLPKNLARLLLKFISSHTQFQQFYIHLYLSIVSPYYTIFIICFYFNTTSFFTDYRAYILTQWPVKQQLYVLHSSPILRSIVANI